MRLIREGAIESDERGRYRFSTNGHPLREFIHRWRRGESRVVPWQGGWLVGWLPKLPPGRLQKDKKALHILGFREGLVGLWVRPDNLNLNVVEIFQFLRQLGGHQALELFCADRFNPQLIKQWIQFLWPVDDIIKVYDELQLKLTRSAHRLLRLPLDEALRESYILGSQAIHCLNTDPLLPEKVVSSRHRVLLTDTMLTYDDLGKQIWLRRFNDIDLNQAPSHMQMVPTLQESVLEGETS